MKNDIKFAFFGTPEVAAETLEILKQNGYLPRLIVTAPDKPVGRKQIITPPPVKVWAEKNNIPVLQPEKLDLNLKDFDLFIVVAYGKIFPEKLINAPKYGTLNIHYSLLPKYRGAAPVQAAILNGDTETGVTIQKMVKELDAGPIVAQEKTQIGPDEKTPELLQRLIKAGGELLVKILTTPAFGTPSLIKEGVGGGNFINQDESKVTFAPKIKKEDGLIDLNDDPIKNYNKFRAFYDWPRTYFIKDGKRNIITEAELKDSKFIIKKIIPEGGKESNY